MNNTANTEMPAHHDQPVSTSQSTSSSRILIERADPSGFLVIAFERSWKLLNAQPCHQFTHSTHIIVYNIATAGHVNPHSKCYSCHCAKIRSSFRLHQRRRFNHLPIQSTRGDPFSARVPAFCHRYAVLSFSLSFKPRWKAAA